MPSLIGMSAVKLISSDVSSSTDPSVVENIDGIELKFSGVPLVFDLVEMFADNPVWVARLDPGVDGFCVKFSNDVIGCDIVLETSSSGRYVLYETTSGSSVPELNDVDETSELVTSGLCVELPSTSSVTIVGLVIGISELVLLVELRRLDVDVPSDISTGLTST